MRLYHRIKNILIYNVDSLKARCQRFKRGYAWSDVWNMDSWFMRTVKPMLLHLYHNHHGVPMEFENNPEGWKEVLNEIKKNDSSAGAIIDEIL